MTDSATAYMGIIREFDKVLLERLESEGPQMATAELVGVITYVLAKALLVFPEEITAIVERNFIPRLLATKEELAATTGMKKAELEPELQKKKGAEAP